MATYQEQMAEVERRRRMAQALQDQAMQPQGRAVGPVYVGPTALSSVAGIASALRGRYLENKADKQQQQADSAERQRLAAALGGLTGGTPTPQKQAAQETISSLPIEAQQQIIGGQALQTMFPKAPQGYNLSKGEQRWEGGQMVAENPADPKPDKPTISNVNPSDWTPESLAKYAQSGNYGDLVPKPATPKEDSGVWQDMTPQQIQAAGLPAGTSAQRNSKTGAIDVKSKRDTTASLSQKDATTARMKLNTVQLARQQLAKVKAAYEQGISGGLNAFGPVQGMLPTQQGKSFDAAVDQMRSTLTALTRVPGVGSMSDYETKLDQSKFPSRSDYEAVTAQKIQGLEDMLATIENGYKDLLSGGNVSPQQEQPGATQAPPAQTPTGASVSNW